MRTILTEEIKAMSNVIQYSENIGTYFISEEEAIQRVYEAINIIGIGRGIEWSNSIMKKAIELQAKE